MNATGEFLVAVKKVLLVSEELKRLSDDTRDLIRIVNMHEVRLTKLETIIEIAQKPSRFTLPGN